MKSIFRLFVFILLVAGWGLAALSVHVIRTPGQIPVTLLTKERLDWRDTYVDTRQWTLDDVSRHPVVIERVIRTGKSDALVHVVDPEDGDVEQQLADALERAPDGNGGKPSFSDIKKSAEEQLAKHGFRWPWEARKSG